MTADIREFKRPEQTVPHVTGAAVCCDCKHEWVAVIEQSAFEDAEGWLECPGCELERGRMKYRHRLPTGSSVWLCACDNDLFEVSPSGLHCPNCGRTQDFPK